MTDLDFTDPPLVFCERCGKAVPSYSIAFGKAVPSYSIAFRNLADSQKCRCKRPKGYGPPLDFLLGCFVGYLLGAGTVPKSRPKGRHHKPRVKPVEKRRKNPASQ